MTKIIRKNWITLLGMAVGAILGYLYYLNWGCENGCPIKSSAWKMTLYGVLLGGLLLNILQGEINKRKNN